MFRAFLAFALSSSVAVAQTPSSLLACNKEMYRGFDSRLQVSFLGNIPMEVKPVVGFAVLNGRPMTAFADRVVVLKGKGDVAAIASLSPLTGMLASATEIRLTTVNGIQRAGEKGFRLDSSLIPDAGAKLAQDGAVSTLEAVQKTTQVNFTAWLENGQRLPLVAITGGLQKMSWTTAGLAAIVDNALYTYASGSTGVDQTAPDAALAEALDVCMVGPSRAVVMFPNTAVLYDHGRRTILAAFPGRCAWSGSDLFLLDTSDGAMWQVGGLSAVGDLESTGAYLEALSAKGVTDEKAFRELARFVGFDEASRRTHRSNPCAIKP